MDKNGHGERGRRQFFGDKLVVANIGIRPFYEDIKKQNATVFQVEWQPPAGGEQELVDLLDKLI
jgi:hypothetical protein